MKTKAFKLASLTVALLAAVILTVGYVFAWFFDSKNADFSINGKSAGAYFDSGDGSAEKPFVIANPTHMHNLAVLQNTGRFVSDGVQQQYYFEIKKTVEAIDMSGRYIPPIGNDEFPFIGIFNGNGKTLANLQVTTDKELLKYDYPAESDETYEFSRAVGLFGMTGGESNISNVILENPWVDVASVHTKYFSADAGSVKAAQQVAGIAIGFVAGKCSSIGVRALSAGASLGLNVNGYSTFNSILGALGENVSSAVTGGGHVAGTGGSGAAFGASFDVEGMYDRLIEIEKNKNSATPSWRLPNMGDSSSTSITIAALNKLPFTVNPSASSYSGAAAYETVANNNIGYLFGNQNKVYNKKVSFGNALTLSGNDYVFADGTKPSTNKVIPRYLYKKLGNYIGGDTYNTTTIEPLSAEEYAALPQDILDLIPSVNGDVEGFNSVRISQQYNNVGAQIYSGSDSNGQWSPHGQIIWMGKEYGEGFTMTPNADKQVDYKGDAVDENGIRYTADGNKLDENGYVYNEEYGFFADDSGWTLKIYSVDENGNAENGSGEYYDTTGGLIDENGLAYDAARGYFVSTAQWPLTGYSICEEEGDNYGYLVNGDGDPYVDNGGNKVFGYGYGLGEYVAGAGYTLQKNGVPLQIDMGWGMQNVYAKTGTHVKAKSGSPVEFYRFIGGVAMPNNGIWFKPSQAGKIRLIMYAESSGDGFTLIKGKRTNATKENPFYVDYGNQGNKEIETTELAKAALPAWVLFYFEYDIPQDEIDEGTYEYWLIRNDGGGGGAYFVYMDLGASAADDTSGIDREKAVSAVDFIYDGVEIKQGDPAGDAADAVIKVGDFIVKTSGGEALYESSKTSVYFEDIKTVFKLVFLRLHSEEGKHSGKTICLEQSNPVPDKDSEVKATFATYVCPTISGGSGTVSGGGGTVTPAPDPPVPDKTITGVTVTGSAGNVKVGDKLQLSATVEGTADNKSVTWSVTSGAAYAEISSTGELLGKSAGKVTVRATSDFDNTVYGEFEVTVEAAQSGGETVEYSVSAGTLDAALDDGIIKMTAVSGKGYDSRTSDKWSGTINGEERELVGGLRAGGSGRAVKISVEAGTKVTVAFGGNCANAGNTGKIWFGTEVNTAEANALAVASDTTDSAKVASGVLEYMFETAGDYYIILDGSNSGKPTIFAIIFN